jgi:hypothetical protein
MRILSSITDPSRSYLLVASFYQLRHALKLTELLLDLESGRNSLTILGWRPKARQKSPVVSQVMLRPPT